MYGSAPLTPSSVLLNDVVKVNNLAFQNQEILFLYNIFFWIMRFKSYFKKMIERRFIKL
jgi:hypothetical protein